ncbi:hypothetical protein IW261DRAFT_1569037 [Armillaria novae-zelandiae]|uniref:Uncharacterized protein n=1 Tax=Armillaria novae-zelandiae TaxID=153914 RepID=A0AA39NYL0_9AGAR|nr:hypothetical protein IW261DRAFT_1569037 [Armillaria novae-zelandiae]
MLQPVQSFFKAGIPVWQIISIKELPGVCVNNICEFSNSPHPEEPSCLHLPMIFTGSSRDPTKYKKIHEFVTHSMCWVDPFALSSPIVKYRADMPLIEANTTKSRYSPYQKKQHIQSGASNRLQDVQHQLLPPIIELWHLALLAVDANPARCHSCGHPSPENKRAIPRENQYAFPRPDIIATLNTEQKVHSYLISWLWLRGPLFARLTIPECLPPNLYHQEWQTVLGMGFLRGDPASRTVAEKRWTEVRKMMDGFHGGAACCIPTMLQLQLFGVEECQEILWELAEVNFRCEFKALHRHTIGPNVQNLPIMCCFPDGDHLPGQLDIEGNWTWEDMPPSLLSEVRMAGWTEKEFLLVENTVANYYCDTFWQYFEHAPVLPWQLLHQTSEDYVPETRPQMTTSRSGVYVDVEELS